MIVYLEVEGSLKTCELLDDQHKQIISDLSALASGLRDNEALLLLASARKGIARMIAETGEFIVVEKT